MDLYNLAITTAKTQHSNNEIPLAHSKTICLLYSTGCIQTFSYRRRPYYTYDTSASYDQGIYAMAQAYGGIVSRLLFQPLEENARLLFSRQHRSIMEQQQRKSVVSTTAIHQQQRQHLTTVAAKNDELEDTFCLLVKFVLYISLLSCMASNYTSILLRILVCSKWTTTQYSTATNNNSPSAVLSAFCYYTSLLALNGMTEAFVYGVFVHGCVGCIFAVTAPMLVKRYQTVGLVIANGLSMILRSTYSLVLAAGRKTFCLNHFSFGFAFLCLFLRAIIYCFFQKSPCNFFFFLIHIKGYFSDLTSSHYTTSKKTSNDSITSRWSTIHRLMKKILPKTQVLCTFMLTLYVTSYSHRMLMMPILDDNNTDVFILRAAQHIGIGAFCTLIILIVAVLTETSFRHSILKLVRVKQD